MKARSTTFDVEILRREWDEVARRAGPPDFESGEVEVAREVLADPDALQGKSPRDMRVLEIGCGTGRMTRALSRAFGAVYAVDFSAAMVRRARAALRGCPNAHVFQNDGRTLRQVREALAGAPVDLALAYAVFPHVGDRSVLVSYARETGRLLRTGALFKLQVTAAGFDEQALCETARRCGFDMRRRICGDPWDTLWWFRAEPERPAGYDRGSEPGASM